VQEVLIAGAVVVAVGAIAWAGRRGGGVRRAEERVHERDRLLHEREARIVAGETDLEKRRKEARDRETALAEREARLAKEERTRLLEVSGLTEEEARRRYLESLDRELSEERTRRVAAALSAARMEAERRAREIVVAAIERTAVSHCVEATVARVPIAGPEMKGRVIGKDGRNAKAFEMATGCTLIVDERQDSVAVSGFDAVRREVARRALARLVEDGRVQPSRIEEVVAEVRRELEGQTASAAAEACREAGVPDLPGPLLELVGRLRFRTSYGQNALRHSVEAALLAGHMANELGLDAAIARRAALLHDAGKAMDAGLEGTHDALAADLARRCGEREEVVNAIAASHEAVSPSSPYAVLARVADAVSSARPGARRDEQEKVARRLKELEAVAASFPGVAHAYALEAGREVRVIVDAGRVDDASAVRMAHDIARAIEAKVTYPGEVQVTVVREVRAAGLAR
jgi:ribonuclease Y